MALGYYERTGAYGVHYSPMSRRKNFRRVFTRFAARFLPISLIFSYSENLFVVVYPSFYFILRQDASARDFVCYMKDEMHDRVAPKQARSRVKSPQWWDDENLIRG